MSISNETTESLLHKGLVQPPADFHEQVMLRIAEHEKIGYQSNLIIASKDPSNYSAISWWQWLILLPGSIIGASQMMRFVFSMWLATAAG